MGSLAQDSTFDPFEEFWEAVRYNADRAARNAKPRHKGIGRSDPKFRNIGDVIMKPDEVVKRLDKLGVKTSRRSLLRWETAGLIPEATRQGGGRGVGIVADYPDETPAEAYAAWRFMHGSAKMTPETVAEIRSRVLTGTGPSCELWSVLWRVNRSLAEKFDSLGDTGLIIWQRHPVFGAHPGETDDILIYQERHFKGKEAKYLPINIVINDNGEIVEVLAQNPPR